MEEVIRLLQELRSGKMHLKREFAEACKRLGLPRVRIYAPAVMFPGVRSGWRINPRNGEIFHGNIFHETHLAYVLTKRNDAIQHIWFLVPSLGKMMVCTQEDRNGIPLEQWDPKADLYMFEREGESCMDPFERANN